MRSVEKAGEAQEEERDGAGGKLARGSRVVDSIEKRKNRNGSGIAA